MLELRGLTKTYNVFPAVDNLTVTISPTEIIGLLGPNGAGKSTAIKMLAGLLEPTEGSIYYNGKNVLKNLYDFKKRLGYVPEQSEIYPHLSALDCGSASKSCCGCFICRSRWSCPSPPIPKEWSRRS